MDDFSNQRVVKLALDQIKALTSQVRLGYIDLVVDQSGIEESLTPLLIQLSYSIEWVSLFEGLPEEKLINHSPLLVRFYLNNNLHDIYIKQFIQLLYNSQCIMFLISPLKFSELVDTLKALIEIKWGNKESIFRFYDCRIFSKLKNFILTDEQWHYFSDIAYMWGGFDRDLNLIWQEGSYQPDKTFSLPSTIEITDQQFAKLDLISEVTGFLLTKKFYSNDLTKEENFQKLYEIALEANDSDYLGDLSSYIEKFHPHLPT